MSRDLSTFFETWQTDRQNMKVQAPAVSGAFGTFYQAVMKDGALSVRDKELIAAGISIATLCTPCIHLHVRGAIKAGATREQVLEAAGVAVMMRGGPAFTHLPEVLAVIEHLQGKP